MFLRDDAIADFYEIAVERLARAGIPRYEISNFARAGVRIAAQPEILAARAVPGLRRRRAFFRRRVTLAECRNGGRICRASRRIGCQFASETPPPIRAKSSSWDCGWSEGIEADVELASRTRCGGSTRDGLLERDGNRLRLTPRGVLLSNEVFAEFV